MSENPLQTLLKTCESLSRCAQAHLSRLFPPQHSIKVSSAPPPTVFSFATKTSVLHDPALPKPRDGYPSPTSPIKEKAATPLTKEELGRATWTLLHTIAAQFPDNPSRQQKRDVKELMAILSRLYPCKDCADHFKEILRANPVQAGSHAEFSQWLCHIHNVVNRRYKQTNLCLLPLLNKASPAGKIANFMFPKQNDYLNNSVMLALILFNSLGKLIFPCQRVDARWGKLDCKDRSCDVQGTSDLNLSN